MGACAIPRSQGLGEQCLCVVVIANIPAEFVRGPSMPNMACAHAHASAHTRTYTQRHTSKAALVSGTSHVPVHVPLLTLIRNIRSQKLGSWIAPPCVAQARFATKLMA